MDFEFCSDLNDDFANLPEKGGQPLIFMIGCGHVENGEWQFEQCTTANLTEEEELRIIREWVDHMAAVQERLAPGEDSPRIFHWSAAEVSALDTAYNSARARHGATGRLAGIELVRFPEFRDARGTRNGKGGAGVRAESRGHRDALPRLD